MERSNISQRDAFWERVYTLAKEDRNVIIITADMGAPALDRIRTDLSSQFINVGIAEQNAIVIATGLALTGKKVFVYAIAPFITLRCFEQIRVENSIMGIPITLVGVGAGFGYEDSGPTHHLLEDISVIRALPNITIHSITDSIMASKVADISYRMNHTNYVRLDRQVLPNIYLEDTDFSEGLSVVKPAKDYYIVSTGSMTHLALEISQELNEQGIDIGVIDIYRIPINQTLFLEKVKDAKKIITLEEHFLPGGLGSTVCEILIDSYHFVPVKRIGLKHEKGYSYTYGGRDNIRIYYGVDKESAKRKVVEFIT